MLHNPEDYSEPERFNPDRFIKNGKLNPEIRDPTTVSFGFGRRYFVIISTMLPTLTIICDVHLNTIRICPGRWLSSGSLFMTIATVLHTLEIHPVPSPDGELFDPLSYKIEGVIS